MNNHGKILAGVFAAATVTIAGCTYNDGTPNRPATGVVIGGLSGAAAGQIIGQNPQAVVIGGALGAAVGGAIGAQMETQERELRQSLAGTGAEIRNTGDDLRVILPYSVTFRTDSSVVDPAFRPALRTVATSLRRHPNSTVRVEGHTDNVGAAAYNLQLSQDRALSVAQELIANGIRGSRIVVSGRGFYEPVASNATTTGRAENRRVEIIIRPVN